MDNSAPTAGNRQSGALLQKLASDQSGNTLALLAAALFPILAMVGGGVDIGRAYVAESRLQQACDAGVLAARKRLGSDLPPSDQVVGQIAKTGKEFFDLNYPDKRYDAKKRKFNMSLEADYAISGSASIELPTSVMGVFGYDMIPISVTCQSRMNFTNLDIMMVLDTTGSMQLANAGDSASRMETMRAVIKSFHSNIEIAKAPDTRIRYGFVPYATNVNVGHLLADDWVADEWTYQSRELGEMTSTVGYGFSNIDWEYVSGDKGDWLVESTYATNDGACPTKPQNTNGYVDTVISTTTQPYAGPPEGTETFEYSERLTNGSEYRVSFDGTQCVLERRDTVDYLETFTKWTRPYEFNRQNYVYKPLLLDVSNWRTDTEGCMEERLSSQISDFTNVDLAQNLDLDLNTIPSASDPNTQWKPRMVDDVYAREVLAQHWLNPNFSVDEVTTTNHYLRPGLYWYSDCPDAKAEKLVEMDAAALDTYLATLNPEGATYHDIGMIWGGRLLSQNGLFASENGDVSGNKPTSRHLIFLTDGHTEPYDVAYGAYGIEPLDQRRWDQSSPMSLVETVEERFKFACNEVKKNNTTVWVIAFGTTLNPAMTECAGPGQYFEADNAAELQKAFSDIAKSMGDLRISG